MSSATSPARPGRLRIVVLGYLVRGPVGGMAWHHLQYLLGLHRLGHDVRFLEDSGDSAWCCYDPERGVTDANPGYGLRFAEAALTRLGLPDCWAYWDAHAARWHGPRARDAATWARSADVLLNLSGINPLREWTADIPRRVLVDTDPVFTQIKHLTDPVARATAAAHNAFFTFGENFRLPEGRIPDDGFPWHPTRQPVVLDQWPVTPPPRQAAFTTVMLWDSYPARVHAGVEYGMKSQSFGPYLDLPRRSHAHLELALGGPGAPRDSLAAHGWSLANPLDVALGPWDYQDYIRRSAGEFSVAKHGYVVSRSGWFSERTAAYLASGRPAVVQDTGFGSRIPVGAGLFAFADPGQAAAALEEVAGDLPRHARAARELAVSYFDSNSILADLLQDR